MYIYNAMSATDAAQADAASHVCPRMPTYAHVCGRTLAGVCCRMLTYVDVS